MVVNCEQVWRQVSNYLEGEVDPSLRSAMDEHFRTCARCKSVMEGTRNVVALYGDERMLDVPSGFSRRLEKRLAQGARMGRGWSTWSAWLVPAAALALIVGSLGLARSETLNHPLKSEHAQPGHDIPPDMLVVVADDAKVFHVAGCDVIHHKDRLRTLTAREAIQEGDTPCLRCLRKYLSVAKTERPVGYSEARAGVESDSDEDELRPSGQ
jgi:putative zinc finger protein